MRSLLPICCLLLLLPATSLAQTGKVEIAFQNDVLEILGLGPEQTTGCRKKLRLWHYRMVRQEGVLINYCQNRKKEWTVTRHDFQLEPEEGEWIRFQSRALEPGEAWLARLDFGAIKKGLSAVRNQRREIEKAEKKTSDILVIGDGYLLTLQVDNQGYVLESTYENVNKYKAHFEEQGIEMKSHSIMLSLAESLLPPGVVLDF